MKSFALTVTILMLAPAAAFAQDGPEIPQGLLDKIADAIEDAVETAKGKLLDDAVAKASDAIEKALDGTLMLPPEYQEKAEELLEKAQEVMEKASQAAERAIDQAKSALDKILDRIP